MTWCVWVVLFGCEGRQAAVLHQFHQACPKPCTHGCQIAKPPTLLLHKHRAINTRTKSSHILQSASALRACNDCVARYNSLPVLSLCPLLLHAHRIFVSYLLSMEVYSLLMDRTGGLSGWHCCQ